MTDSPTCREHAKHFIRSLPAPAGYRPHYLEVGSDGSISLTCAKPGEPSNRVKITPFAFPPSWLQKMIDEALSQHLRASASAKLQIKIRRNGRLFIFVFDPPRIPGWTLRHWADEARPRRVGRWIEYEA